MKQVCQSSNCTGCGMCSAGCPQNAIRVRDEISHYEALIDETLCNKCGLCVKRCPGNASVELIEPVKFLQGWASNEEIRKKSSSGGVATAVIRSFIKNGGVVCSCKYEDNDFVFGFAEDIEETNLFTGSKYVKSNTKDIFKRIQHYLVKQKKLLFVGLPCQVAAVKQFVGRNLADRGLYTMDLICHGTPSVDILRLFMEEKRIDPTKVQDVKFRDKMKFALKLKNYILDEYHKVDLSDGQDGYLHVFLNGLCYTDNCYECKYARVERVADLSLGDSWGSELDDLEKKKGISLILCQTDKGKELLEQGEVELYDVNISRAIECNAQLQHAFVKPKERDTFVATIKKYHSFKKALRKSIPNYYFKKRIKQFIFLIRKTRA